MHGIDGEDPTEPPRSSPYPLPPLPHEPTIERFASSLRQQGLHPFHTPNGMNLTTQEHRRQSTASDGTPSQTDHKSEAENRALRPALESDRVRLLTEAKVTRLLTDAKGTRIVAAEAEFRGRTIRITANQFVVSAGAVNTAALLLRSADERNPDGLGNSSGLLGRNYMVHNSTFFMGVNPFHKNTTAWQKTLGINDWYVAGPNNEYPLGNLQMLGKLQAAHVKGARPWAPLWALKAVVNRSLDIYLTTEDLRRGTTGSGSTATGSSSTGHPTTLRRTVNWFAASPRQSARRGIRSSSPSEWGSRRTRTCAEPRSRVPIRRRVSSTRTAAVTTSTTCGSWTDRSSLRRRRSTPR